MKPTHFQAFRATALLIPFMSICGPIAAQPISAPQPRAQNLPGHFIPVPPMNWANIKPDDFADNELEIPYLLNHFHRIANAVVETGDNRGFLAIKVARDPKDNEPYNARIMESHLAFSYFYAMKRPWNPYYGSPAVKERLEAMLRFWCKIQGPDGRFSEYKSGEWTLAPTNFGVRAMSQTLELLNHPGNPTIDPVILQETMAAQRKAILSLLTLEDNIRWGREYSNQYSGVYQAALSYMQLKPDAEMRTALERATKRVVAEHQSPAGFMYEWGGADFGYSGVHDNNLRLAWYYVRQEPIVRDLLLLENRQWHTWLSYNLVMQPGSDGYLTNAGVNTRTSHSFQTATPRPMAENVKEARPFAPTQDEYRQQIADTRRKLAADWPHFKELVVPSAYSYNFGAFHDAYREPNTWFPTRAQKAAAVAQLPYIARTAFVHQANDPRPYSFTFIRRPDYYAILNTGKIRRPEMQVYGLGLLWNPTMGVVMQSVAGTEWKWGTRPVGTDAVIETKDVLAQTRIGGRSIDTKPGIFDYPADSVKTTYALVGGGQKSILLDASVIAVSVQRVGEFSEQLPLLLRRGAKLAQAPDRVTVSYAGTVFTIAFPPGTVVEIPPAKPFRPELERVLVLLQTHDKLTYTLTFSK